jgi:MFS family permease
MPSEFGSSISRFGLAAGGYAFGPIGAAVGPLLGGFLFGSSGPDIDPRNHAGHVPVRRPSVSSACGGSAQRALGAVKH